MRKQIKGKRKKFRVPNRKLVIIELSFYAAFAVFVLPLLHKSLRFVMDIWGDSYITEKNLLSFLFFPPTLLALIGFLVLLSLFLLWKVATMITYCFTISTGNKPRYINLHLMGFLKTFKLLWKGNIWLPLYALMLYLFTNIPMLIVIIVKTNLPVNISNEMFMFLRCLLLLCLGVLSYFSFRWLFALHYCINEDTKLSLGIKQSRELLANRKIRAAGSLLLSNLLILLGFYLFYNTFSIILALFVYMFAEKEMAVTTFLSYYPKLKLYLTLLLGLASGAINLNLISSLYHSYREESDPHFSLQIRDYQEELTEVLPAKQQKRTLFLLLLIFLTAGIVNFYLAVKNDSLFLQESLSGIQIVSHRGSSSEAPENTLPALEYAIQAHSNYAEIDVQQTADGVLVLFHDNSLKRTTGASSFVWKSTYDELKLLDAGAWFDEQFIGTRIPTLEEALALCKGRIKLNIEIKIHGREQGLEEQLIELIEQYDFKNQCVVSSWNYHSLVRLKQLDNEIRTGHIISTSLGQFYNREYIDFLSLRSSSITQNVMEQAHKAGKEVHAWTVNTRSEMERMKSLGVDSIITDNPHLAKEILLRDDTNDTFVELLNKMLRYNSLYQIIRK